MLILSTVTAHPYTKYSEHSFMQVHNGVVLPFILVGDLKGTRTRTLFMTY